MKLSALRRLSGHPLHPTMTDGAIGSSAVATVLACVGAEKARAAEEG
jgi:hypothetical protein